MSGFSQPTDPQETRAADETTEPAGAPTPEPEASGGSFALQEDPEQVRLERDDYRDRLLRSIAEFDNYRKRVDRERRDFAEFAAAELLQDLLPLVDDLERALAAPAAEGSAAAGYRVGVELIHRQLLDLLRKRGVTVVEALGADFDPHVHQAVASEASDRHRDGEVMEELRRGYRLGERLLRPAMVKVAARE